MTLYQELTLTGECLSGGNFITGMRLQDDAIRTKTVRKVAGAQGGNAKTPR